MVSDSFAVFSHLSNDESPAALVILTKWSGCKAHIV